MNACPCTVCGEGGHHPRACPTLWAPLKSGFYAPPAGHRPSGDDDDDDEHVAKQMKFYYKGKVVKVYHAAERKHRKCTN